MELCTDSFISKSRVSWLYTSLECELCSKEEEETTSHIILRCEAYNRIRNKYINTLKNILEKEEYILLSTNDTEFLKYILGFSTLSGKWWLLWEHTLEFLRLIAVTRRHRLGLTGNLKNLIQHLKKEKDSIRPLDNPVIGINQRSNNGGNPDMPHKLKIGARVGNIKILNQLKLFTQNKQENSKSQTIYLKNKEDVYLMNLRGGKIILINPVIPNDQISKKAAKQRKAEDKGHQADPIKIKIITGSRIGQ